MALQRRAYGFAKEVGHNREKDVGEGKMRKSYCGKIVELKAIKQSRKQFIM